MGSMFMRYPGGKKKALTLSYDDGVEQDIRLIELMKKNGLKGTFNLNSGLYAEEGTVYPPGTVHRRMTEKMATEVYGSSGMEVAVHGGDKRQGEFGEAVSNDRKGYGISLRNYQ